jgi:UDP-N-acetylmuramyl pentapeptide synthase
MNELGEASSTEHKRLGVLAAAAADEVVGVHGEAWHFAAEAKLAGKIGKFFGHAEDAAAYLTSRLQSGDLILVKGSQNAVRLEKAAAKLLENPNDTAKLCRQGEYWQTH